MIRQRFFTSYDDAAFATFDNCIITPCIGSTVWINIKHYKVLGIDYSYPCANIRNDISPVDILVEEIA